MAELVASQVRMAHECGVEAIRIVATAAIRQAANRAEFCEAVEAAAGLPVAVLSGDDEARLAFAGATRTLQHAPLGEIGVVDVGGGSSELVAGTMADGVSWSASFRVGSAFLADGYLRVRPAVGRRARPRAQPRRGRLRGARGAQPRRRLRRRRQRDVAARGSSAPS